jgi:hypothetical protein
MTSLIPSGVVAGHRVKYFSPTGNSYVWTVASISLWGSQIVTSDGTIPGTELGGYVTYLDLYDSYFVQVTIQSINKSGIYETIGTLRVKSGLEGEIKVNPSLWLQSLAVFQNKFDYDRLNEAVEGEGGRYALKFRESINGVLGLLYTPFPIMYWSNSAKQIQAVYGSNMGDFVPTIDATRKNRAKFLSVFTKPTYFPNFPFSLNFIYSENLLNLQVTREEDEFNINGGIVAHNSDNVDFSQRFHNNRLMISQDYPSTTREVDVWLVSGTTILVSRLDGGTIYEPDVFETVPIGEPTIKPEISIK